ncbi:MAG: hypothetical protein BZY80_05485 [SAR202 cluster bacterium Io17-Chloro-G2]|nr:MAG: hypothetical protein BZY80_05485 [SAR202 cluster bacterium Io17-Chloro-G2]
MYESLTEFLKNASAGNPLVWALLIMATVTVTSLILYGFWEVVLRLTLYRISSGNSSPAKPGERGK